jgi:hypothetical protein
LAQHGQIKATHTTIPLEHRTLRPYVRLGSRSRCRRERESSALIWSGQVLSGLLWSPCPSSMSPPPGSPCRPCAKIADRGQGRTEARAPIRCQWWFASWYDRWAWCERVCVQDIRLGWNDLCTVRSTPASQSPAARYGTPIGLAPHTVDAVNTVDA